MRSQRVGFLHPGAMGVSLAASAVNSGHDSVWTSEDRSAETAARAREHGLTEVRSLAELCETCAIIVSVCPPHAAVEVARAVAACSFSGVFADVNAISPDHSREIGAMMHEAGVDYVDGGIIGGPAWKPGSTWLYLCGPAADEVARCFSAGPLETEVLGDEIGQASALKMCYAANTKGTTALLCAVSAAAEQLGVRAALERHWSRSESDETARVRSRVTGVTQKAWRFSGEMEEIASTFAAAGVPDGFHLAAREIYDRLAGFKGEPTPSLDAVLRALVPESRREP